MGIAGGHRQTWNTWLVGEESIVTGNAVQSGEKTKVVHVVLSCKSLRWRREFWILGR